MSKIEPALSPLEWRVLGRERPDEHLEAWVSHDGEQVVLACDGDDTGAGSPPERHALAALCLHDQPFGFTWEDVDALRDAAADLPHHQGWFDADGDEFRDLADRIAALLPPREGE